MEGIAPPLKCLIEMQSALQNGESVRTGLARYAKNANDVFADDVRRFLFDWDQGRDWRVRVCAISSPHRRALLEIAAQGLSGQPILVLLEELRRDVEDACGLEIKSRLEMLPLKMLFPLLLLLFPSYLLLLFGPILNSFLRELER